MYHWSRNPPPKNELRRTISIWLARPNMPRSSIIGLWCSCCKHFQLVTQLLFQLRLSWIGLGESGIDKTYKWWMESKTCQSKQTKTEAEHEVWTQGPLETKNNAYEKNILNPLLCNRNHIHCGLHLGYFHKACIWEISCQKFLCKTHLFSPKNGADPKSNFPNGVSSRPLCAI